MAQLRLAMAQVNPVVGDLTRNARIVRDRVAEAAAAGAHLVAFHDMLLAVREYLARLKRHGKSLDEVVAAKPTAAFDAKWGGFVIGPEFFTRLVYAGV